ncbi:MAG: sporulation protein YqfD, partial [Oscillospiraceae bacterium]|nr:sporulation protein YqfD [Oscillospiraceae bacterium]
LLKNRMLLEYGELGWLAVNVRGCTATVSYSLARPTPPMIALSDPCDVVAGRRGLVTALNVYRGTAAVRPAQPVLAGDLLISSAVPVGDPARGEVRWHTVHARGEIFARTEYEVVVKSASETAEKRYTGEKRTLWYLTVGKKRVDLWKGGGKGMAGCDIIVSEYELAPGLALGRETRLGYDAAARRSGGEELRRLAGAARRLIELSGDRVSVTAASVADLSSEDAAAVRFSCECVEQIGVSAPPAAP